MPKAAKRERQRQNRMARREAVLAQEKRRKRNRSLRYGAIVAVVLVAGYFILQALNGSSNSSSAEVACGASAPAKPQHLSFTAAPAMSIDTSKTYTAVMKTSCGTVTIALDPKTAPQTVNSFVFLARKGFYNGTTFHRIVKDFVDQGGDPTGTGNGGPGYKLPDEPPTTGYAAGSAAMANSGSGTTGSQFFLVVSDNGAKALNGNGAPYSYSALGTMDVKSLAVAKKVNTFGSASETGTPTKTVYVDSVTITEK